MRMGLMLAGFWSGTRLIRRTSLVCQTKHLVTCIYRLIYICFVERLLGDCLCFKNRSIRELRNGFSGGAMRDSAVERSFSLDNAMQINMHICMILCHRILGRTWSH